MLQAAAAVVAVAIIITQIAGQSSSKMIAFVSFAEIIGFLPMHNLKLTLNLRTFFQGMSSMNFKMLKTGKFIEPVLPEGASEEAREGRYHDAGFDSSSLVRNSSDIFSMVLVTFITASVYALLAKKMKGKGKLGNMLA